MQIISTMSRGVWDEARSVTFFRYILFWGESLLCWEVLKLEA